jgi:thioredoxin 1
MHQVVEVPAESFDVKVKRSNKPVVVEFWIKSCSICKKFEPVYEKLPQVYEDKVKFYKMNMFLSLENLKLAEGFGVEETPTLKVFCEGREIGEIVGYNSLDKAVKQINLVIERDKDCHT